MVTDEIGHMVAIVVAVEGFVAMLGSGGVGGEIFTCKVKRCWLYVWLDDEIT